MIGPTCPECGRIHPSDCVRAGWRFDPPDDYSTTYRADYPDAPIRLSRTEAEADWCAIAEEQS